MATGRKNAPSAHGFLNLYKPAGITSMEALRRVKRATGQRKKVGHAGTIDPLAEGVLPICFGQATRLMEQVVSGRKRYRMTMRLGATSNTYDAEGHITESAAPVTVARSEVAAALVHFVGRIQQVPPMFSAIKVDGRRLYDLARSGKEIERAPRPVQVHEIRIDEISLPYLRLTVDCGKGTYLRSIAHDLGQALGSGAYVTELLRTRCGQFRAEHSLTLEALEETAAESDWRAYLRPVDWALQDCPALRVEDEQEVAIKQGQSIRTNGDVSDVEAPGMWRAYSADGVFLALLEFQADTRCWQPRRVFQGNGVSPYAPPASLYRRPYGQRAEDHALRCDMSAMRPGYPRFELYVPSVRQRRWHHQVPEMRVAPLAHAAAVSHRQRGGRHRADRVEPGRRHPVRPAFERAGLENSPHLLCSFPSSHLRRVIQQPQLAGI